MKRPPHIKIAADYERLRGFVETLPSHPKGEKVLYDRRNYVQMFTIDGIRLVVKQYARPHRLNRFVYTYLRKSKAERTMTIGRKLLDCGVNTPLPVAFVDTYGDDGLYDIGYSVTLFDPNPELRTLSSFDRNRQFAVIEDLAAFTARMHRAGFIHGDFHEGNIFFAEEHGRYTFSIIDTNRGRFHSPKRRRCIKDLILFRFDEELMRHFAYRYAEIMGWQPQRTFEAVIRLRNLRNFDKLRFRPFIKKLLGIKPKRAKDE